MKFLKVESRGSVGELIAHLNLLNVIKRKYNLKLALKRIPLTPLDMEVINRCDVVDEVVLNVTEEKDKYDARLIFQYIPFVENVKENLYEIKEMQKLFSSWKKIQDILERKDYIEKPMYDANILVYALNNKKNITDMLDPSGLLGIKKDCGLRLKRKKDLTTVYGRYITIHAPVSKHTETRRWPKEKYVALIKRLRQEYPEYKVIQLGMTTGEHLENVDIDLSGKLSPTDFCDMLGDAYLHIDTMDDYANLRSAMGRISCVLWGPMPHDVFSLPNNINMHSNGCKHWCMNVSDSWKDRCVHGDLSCLMNITVDQVIRKIMQNKDRLERNGEWIREKVW